MVDWNSFINLKKPKVFINYRRADAPGHTGRLYSDLARSFGEQNVFMDTSTIRLGEEYKQRIRNEVSACDVFIVVIGKQWLEILSQRQGTEDFVRLEITQALGEKTLIVPVTVENAPVLRAEDLPADLKPITERQTFDIRDGRWSDDVEFLIKELKRIRPQAPDSSRASTMGVIAISVGLASILGVLIFLASGFFSFSGGEAREIPYSNNNLPGTTTANKVTDGEEPENNNPAQSSPPEEEPGDDAPVDSTEATIPKKIVPYDPKFLGKVQVPLPVITDKISKGELLNGKVFDYTHYSLVISEKRGMPLYTACNIDGKLIKPVRREKDNWLLDSRVPRDLQKGGAIYSSNEWDRGHIVPRAPVAWGTTEEEAKAAAQSTFFYTNTVPQHSHFNQGVWAYLERRIFDSARAASAKVSVFAGPVFRKTDYEYRGTRIPQSFWKIVVTADSQNDNNLSVQAYLIDQYLLSAADVLQPLPRVPSDGFDPKSYQVSIAEIESLTPLQFGILKQFDTYHESKVSGR